MSDTEDSIEVTFSTRTLLRWAKLIKLYTAIPDSDNFNAIHHSLDRALAFKAEPATKEALHQITQREFGV